MHRILTLFFVMVFLSNCAAAEPIILGDRPEVSYCHGYITLRETPDSSGKALAKTPLGEEVVWLYQSLDGFSYVSYSGKVGFVAGKFLKLLPNRIPECTSPLPVMDNDPLPDNGIGTVYTIDIDVPYR